MKKHLCVWSPRTPLSSDVLCGRFKGSHKCCFLKARSRRSPFTMKVQVIDPYKAACKCTLSLCMKHYEPYLTSHFCSGILLFMHPKWWAIGLTSAQVNEAKDPVRLLYDIVWYGKHICGEVLPHDWITKPACVTIITQARGALLWRSWSHDTMRKGQRDAPTLNGIPTIECQAAHCILWNNKW
jgi:hypothetical protein